MKDRNSNTAKTRGGDFTFQISNFEFQISILHFLVFTLLLFGCRNEQGAHHITEAAPPSPDLMLTNSQIKLSNITMAPVRRKSVGRTVVVNGTLQVDETKSEVISSRAAGRIERLYIKETGRPVVKGQPLYVLYSEKLLTLEQEYLLAREQYETLGDSQPRYKSFLEAAERKLLLYGMTSAQVRALNRNSIHGRTTFVSPASGLAREVNAVEGQYVEEGTVLYRIEDVRSLWVEAQLYANETAFVNVGDKITVRAGERDIEAEVSFLSPEFRNNSQIMIIRAVVPNTGNVLRPGQQAQVMLTHSAVEGIVVPLDAVIRDQKGAHVYLLSGTNTFRPQVVKTGIETHDSIEITQGVNEGDTIAVSGAYLLYSEYVLKKGTDPVAVHQQH